MQFPKFTPLQSRFAASFTASLVLIILYLTFSNPYFAYAIDTDSIEERDHNHPLILDKKQYLLDSGLVRWDEVEKARGYEPTFAGLGRSIIGRASGDSRIDPLENNMPGKKDISPGDQQFWSFSSEELYGHSSSGTPDQDKRYEGASLESGDNGHIAMELRKRQSTDVKFYLTLNVCEQPSAIVPNPVNPPPPLTIYVSKSSKNQRPNPSTQDANQVEIRAEHGYAYHPNSTSDGVYIGVVAPVDSNFQGPYNYELTISINAAYASYEENNTLFYVDSDSNAGLFVSNNLTNSTPTDFEREGLLAAGPRFGVFVHNQNDTSILGISRSYCGLRNHAQVKGNIKGLDTTDVEVGMTFAGGGFLKQQYYVKNLNRSSKYYAMQVTENLKPGPGNINGGGNVSKYISFNTKSDGNCQLIYNLTFCNDTMYAVPSNPSNENFSNSSSLAKFYDDNALKLSLNFNYSLEQVPCNTTSSAQYSLAVTCDDCAQAYKRWLCAVTIPRCADFSSPKQHLQPRNIAQNFTNGTLLVGDLQGSAKNRLRTHTNSSRNRLIDEVIKPGPYMEVLPCKELCYGLVQNCPASLQFACPLERFGLEYNYGSIGSIEDRDYPQCNTPGVFWGINHSSRLKMSVIKFSVGITIALGISYFGI
ncbi:MAG: hypothetical protein Q9187_001217 [Circinaria calcarea]